MVWIPSKLKESLQCLLNLAVEMYEIRNSNMTMSNYVPFNMMEINDSEY